MAPARFEEWTPEHFLTNQTSCQLILEDAEALREIPLVNSAPLHSFKDGELVRFRGMIQDMYNPEYYFENYEVRNSQTGECQIRCGTYKDTAYCLPHEEIIIDSKKNRSSERQTCVVISIPGLNEWAKEKCIKTNLNLPEVSHTSFKRTLEQSVEEMDCSEPIRKKEKMMENSENENTNTQERNNINTLSKEHIMNFPIPIDDGKACIVKIYEDATSYKLNQILEIVGFISLDPALSLIHDSEDAMDDSEVQIHNPPTSLVPRLHAVKITSLTRHHVDSCPQIVSRAEQIRAELHMILSQILFGDTLAADYLICHLISSIYLRKDALCLGSFPINITNFSFGKFRTFPKDLYEILSLLVPKSHYLECSLEALNDMCLIPKKDYDCNRLTSGILQLSNNTHLVIDETQLSSGRVSANGRKNYEAIGDLVKFQKVSYDFTYYPMEFETDIPVLILSEVKSFIPCVIQVIVKPDEDTENLYPQVVQAAKQYLKDDKRLNDIRQYLESMRHSDFQFNDEIVDTIQEDFVKMRQSDQNINADNLHSLMVLARLMSLSHGTNTLTKDYWKQSMDMESRRLERLPRREK
ncbi:mini-chromosome maintenance complex-binding protein isoform X2 [Cephus cinctus]|uniref:Mini-chromosome maintenance complex-binding protein n=1 Tax=Cephus cinctus TaxID=211228 RepID=A0AAJ7BTL3_CEPCN|nr:mini-chromosome maintenance complex-binding protein isoform X2 [Cephus cinctus]